MGQRFAHQRFADSREAIWAAAEGGAKRIAWIWGGENVLQSVLSKTTFGGLRNWGWSGRCLFLLREMTESRQKKGGGKTYRRWGVQKRFWGGVFRRIYGMFSTPLSFPPPSAALWAIRNKKTSIFAALGQIRAASSIWFAFKYAWFASNPRCYPPCPSFPCFLEFLVFPLPRGIPCFLKRFSLLFQGF